MTEHALQKQVITYIRRQYPAVIVFGMALSDLHFKGLTMKQRASQAIRLKAMGWVTGQPDVWIMETAPGYAGMMLELKAKPGTVFKRDGKLKSNPHQHTQARYIARLCERGYFALFAEGWDEAKAAIDWYMSELVREDSNGLIRWHRDRLTKEKNYTGELFPVEFWRIFLD